LTFWKKYVRINANRGEADMKDKQTKKRIIAYAFLICYLFMLLFSGLFVLTHFSHEHDHNGFEGACSACVQLQTIENILKQLGSSEISAVSVICGFFCLTLMLSPVVFDGARLTPVELKIRFNN